MYSKKDNAPLPNKDCSMKKIPPLIFPSFCVIITSPQSRRCDDDDGLCVRTSGGDEFNVFCIQQRNEKKGKKGEK